MQKQSTKLLKCELTEEEIAQKGKQLAHTEEEREQNAAERKAVMAEFKSKDEAFASTINQLSAQINTRSEYRYVPVENKMNYEMCMVETYRRDTGELIATRVMTAEELQQKFAFEGDADSDDKAKSAEA
jgi:hypothetical protein